MDLSDRMKFYEGLACGDNDRLMPLVPACARLDGRAFHSFCRGLHKPFDIGLVTLMQETARYLLATANATVAYTQSDEITLVWTQDDFDSQRFFDGRVCKMTSLLAAMASVFFNKHVALALPQKKGCDPLFDCRVWSVPTLEESANVLVWRELDAVRNSIQMLAQSLYSPNQLHRKNCDQLQEMCWQAGHNWNSLSDELKRGSYFRRVKVVRPFTASELDKLPPKHEARANPNLQVERTDYQRVRIPPLTRIDNRCDVLFRGADPIVTVLARGLDLSGVRPKEQVPCPP